ncbi:MAG: hypothetical protein K2Q97_18190 [Burkholderiaceae bacterium]|nr:hypothetical protein [Burkholderiaceae bacterium]
MLWSPLTVLVVPSVRGVFPAMDCLAKTAAVDLQSSARIGSQRQPAAVAIFRAWQALREPDALRYIALNSVA